MLFFYETPTSSNLFRENKSDAQKIDISTQTCDHDDDVISQFILVFGYKSSDPSKIKTCTVFCHA